MRKDNHEDFFMNNSIYHVYRMLMDSTIREGGKKANDAAIAMSEVVWKKKLPLVGYYIDPNKGMYIVLQKEVVDNNPHKEAFEEFDFYDVICKTESDYWLCVYDLENGKPVPSLRLFTKRTDPLK